MRLKIRCDGESEKFCKFFQELKKALATLMFLVSLLGHVPVERQIW